MSREILFRGKRIDNGIFVYGSAVLSGSHAHISVFERIDKGNNALHTNYPVRPETLGEYTGLKDRNGNRIFEGDIVHCFSETDSANMVVIFEEGEFRMVLCEKFKSYVTGGGYYLLRFFVKEIIGNIHDNPELMEGVMKDD